MVLDGDGRRGGAVKTGQRMGGDSISGYKIPL